MLFISLSYHNPSKISNVQTDINDLSNHHFSCRIFPINPVAFSAGTWYNNNNKNPGKIAETSRGENMKPFLLFDLHRNINSDVVKFIKSILKCPSITAICTPSLNGRIPIKCLFKSVYATLCIMNICCMDANT